MAFRIDVEKIKDDIVTTLQAGIATEITTINGETSDFDVVAPPAENYYTTKKAVLNQVQDTAIILETVDEPIEYYSGSARSAHYEINLVIIHAGPTGDEEDTMRYTERMVRVMDQTILAENMATTYFGTAYIEYIYCQSVTFNDPTYSDGMVIKNAVMHLLVQEATEVLS